MAQWLPDGTTEFLGRIDNQINWNGLRIEPSEIEVYLNQLPDVKDSVVVIQEYDSNQKQLVAYIVSKEEEGLSRAEYQEYLSEKLPVYMIPSVYIGIPIIPLTRNGKIDRIKLPRPSRIEHRQANAFEIPNNAIGKVVSEIWVEVLKIDKIGIHDCFLDLGGNSLNAIQITSRLRDVFDIEIPIRALLESSQTISEITRYVEMILQLRQPFGAHEEEQKNREELIF